MKHHAEEPCIAMAERRQRARRELAWLSVVSCFAVLAFVAAVSFVGAARAQPGFRGVRLPEGVVVAIPAHLREVTAPALPTGAPGTLRHVYTDGAPSPLTVWLQAGPPQPIMSMPEAGQPGARELAAGLASGVPGAYDVVTQGYDPERGALRFQFKARGAAPTSPPVPFSGVAFMTRLGTVLALSTAALPREKDVELTASTVWQHSTVLPSALLPVEGALSPTNVGRWLGIVLGSVLGAAVLGGAAAWVLVKAGMSGRSALAIAGALLVAFGVVGVARSGARFEALLQLACYVLLSGLAHGLLAQRLERFASPRRSSRPAA